MATFDITLLTDRRYVHPQPGDWYVENIFREDALLTAALQRRGLRVHRTHWDDPGMDWAQTRAAVFRTTWDYFDRFAEFDAWLGHADARTRLINPLSVVRWNMDKRYLADLQAWGVRIPPTVFISKGDARSLAEIAAAQGWDDCVLKPAVGGAARHTYRIGTASFAAHEAIFRELIAVEDMLLQVFLRSITDVGELTLMLMDGHHTHAVRKRARVGDFRVQDDFGGSVHDEAATPALIGFAEELIRALPTMPAYARVDVMWDDEGRPCVSELELIEPELWLRQHPPAAEAMAEGILRMLG